MPRARVAGIILKDDAVALIERRRGGEVYYLFRGGGAEGDEALAAALTREIREELGLQIKVDTLVAEVVYQGSTQYYFTSTVTGGAFGTGRGQEIVGPTMPEDGTYTPAWIPVKQMRQYRIFPKDIVELILNAIEVGWPATPSEFTDLGRA